jgi:uncharacterized protein (TIGR00730 family)
MKRSKDKSNTESSPRSAPERAAVTGRDAVGAAALAFYDDQFMQREDLTSVRLQLEFLKPELVQIEQGIKSTVVIFGSARIPEPEEAAALVSRARERLRADPASEALKRALAQAERVEANSVYYREARKLGAMITRANLETGPCDMVVMTGGGPGIMEAANRGARDAGGKSIGLNIQLPFEQAPNPYISPELCFEFHYFAIRKMHFLKRARALIACPGGYGTLDELFDALTLVQTGKIESLPILLMGRRYWDRVLHLDAMVEEGVISADERELVQYVDSAEEAWSVLESFYEF